MSRLYYNQVRTVERSKALGSGRSPLCWRRFESCWQNFFQILLPLKLNEIFMVEIKQRELMEKFINMSSTYTIEDRFPDIE